MTLLRSSEVDFSTGLTTSWRNQICEKFVRVLLSERKKNLHHENESIAELRVHLKWSFTHWTNIYQTSKYDFRKWEHRSAKAKVSAFMETSSWWGIKNDKQMHTILSSNNKHREEKNCLVWDFVVSISPSVPPWSLSKVSPSSSLLWILWNIDFFLLWTAVVFSN